MKLTIRNLLIGLVIVIVLAVVLLRGDQLVELIDTIKKGAVIPLVAAVCTQLGKYFAQSFSYSFCFEAVDEHMNPRETLPLVFGTFFVNTIAPSLNLAGTTLVVDDARRRGIAPGRATSAALLMQITVDSGFATIMLIGFAILAATVGLSPVWFLLGLLVIALVGVMVLILVLGRKRPALVLKALRPVERLVDRVLVRFKKKPLDPWVERVVGSFSDAAGLIAHNPKTTAKAFGCSIAASACELACFSLVGVAFGAHSPEALICGYVVATLFAMISITPQGVGVVEAAVVVAFTSFGVSGAAGLSIALVYRGIVFWMPASSAPSSSKPPRRSSTTRSASAGRGRAKGRARCKAPPSWRRTSTRKRPLRRGRTPRSPHPRPWLRHRNRPRPRQSPRPKRSPSPTRPPPTAEGLQRPTRHAQSRRSTLNHKLILRLAPL